MLTDDIAPTDGKRMLYLIRPPRTVEWVDLPHHVLDIAVEHGGLDLARLQWVPTEQIKFHPAILRLALRSGVPCSAGIVVKGTDLVPYTWLLELYEVSKKPARLQDLPNEDLMEFLTPGWKERSRELDERVAQSMLDTITRAERELAEELANLPTEGVVQHWRELGGALPDPV
ncbi:hypothetical protein ACIBJI_42005 [Nocardia sp. NPDC050408]|uniref:hypothetical protein n=1 Tax=Nocardia sp. NPDC050408 TaxID=3364319 RepID=UPI0037B4EC7F